MTGRSTFHDIVILSEAKDLSTMSQSA